jgi:hypothetical protein
MDILKVNEILLLNIHLEHALAYNTLKKEPTLVHSQQITPIYHLYTKFISDKPPTSLNYIFLFQNL